MADDGCVVRPGVDALALSCDKLFARTVVGGLGDLSVPVPAFVPVSRPSDVAEFADRHGWPVVLKARRGGYDGRGVVVADDPAAVERVLAPGGDGDGPQWIAEEHLDLAVEFAVLLARSPSGHTATYPPIGTLQVEGICRELTIPADLPEPVVRQGAVGTVDPRPRRCDRRGRRRVLRDDRRPAAAQRVRLPPAQLRAHHHRGVRHLAVPPAPPGRPRLAARETGLLRPAATVNLIAGAATPGFAGRLPRALAVPDVHVHLYRKDPRPGRKVGHVTALGDSVDEALERARTRGGEVLRMSDDGSSAPAPPVSVSIVMGSSSDLPVMEQAAAVLDEFGVPHEVRVVSAHRTPHDMVAFGAEAEARGVGVIIAGAGGAAHLPGMLASLVSIPVIGVPVPLRHLDGMDSLLSIVQMPKGVPVAAVAIGNATNAGLLAVRMVAIQTPELRRLMTEYRQSLARSSCESGRTLRADRPGTDDGPAGATGGPASA